MLASRCTRPAILMMSAGNMYEIDDAGEQRLLYEQPLPIGTLIEGADGLIYACDERMDIYRESNPRGGLPATTSSQI